MALGPGARVGRLWRRLAETVTWSPPTASELESVAKAGVAAGLAWWVATLVSDEAEPMLSALTALVVVQVSLRGSIRTAMHRTLAVVVGVVFALAVGDALDLNSVVVGLLVAGSLGVSELLMRLPRAAARQVPISVLAVLSATSQTPQRSSWLRILDTLLGAAVGIAVSFAFPASRVSAARRTLQQLADGLSRVLSTMGLGLQEPWSTEHTAEWRSSARTIRVRLVAEAIDTIGGAQEAVRWNVRDRPHREMFERFDVALPRLERAAIGVSVIARGLDDSARLSGETHPPMVAMGELLQALAVSIDALGRGAIDPAVGDDLARSLDEVRARREVCVRAASRRATAALERSDDVPPHVLESEWLNYTAILVQVDRIVADLSAPSPS